MIRKGIVAALLWLSSLGHADIHATVGTAEAYNTGRQGSEATFGLLWDRKWELSYGLSGEIVKERTGVEDEAYRYFALERRFVARKGKAIKPFFTLGVARFHNPPTELLGCKWQHTESLGLVLGNYTEIGIKHWSSRSRCEPNTGVDKYYIKFILEI